MVIDEFLIRLGAIADDSGIKSFAKALGGLGTLAGAASLAIGGALAGINSFVGGALGQLDELKNVAERTDQSLEFIQKLGYTAQLNGSSIEASTRSIEGLSQVIGEAANGLGRGAATFDKLGLSARNADGSVKTVEQMLGEVQEMMKDLSAPQQQSLLAKLGIDASMIQTLRLGRDELNAFYQEAHDLGVITAEGADAAADYNDAMDRLRMVQNALRTNIAVGLAPTFINLTEKMKSFLIANKDIIRNGISKLVSILVSAGTALWNFFRAIDQVITKTIGWKAALIALAAFLGVVFATNPVVLLAAALIGIIALVDDFITYLDGGESQFGPFWQKLIDYAKAAKRIFNDNIGVFKALGVVIGGLALGKVAGGFLSIVGAGGKLIGLLAGPLVTAVRMAATVFRVMFLSNPIGIVIALVALLAYAIYENFDKIKQWVGDAWDWVSDKTNTVVQAIIAYFAPIIDFFQTTFGVIGDLITGNFSGAFDQVMAFWDRTIGRISAGVERVKGFFRSIGKTLGVVNDEVADVAVNVNGKVQAAQVSGTQSAVQAASSVNNSASVSMQQDVKMEIHTTDPVMAGKQAAADLKRQNQLAQRNMRGAVAF